MLVLAVKMAGSNLAHSMSMRRLHWYLSLSDKFPTAHFPSPAEQW
jgi:hypothetical protein